MRLRCSQSQWPTMAGAAEAINDGSGELVPVAAFVDEEHRTRTDGSQVYDREKKPIRIGVTVLEKGLYFEKGCAAVLEKPNPESKGKAPVLDEKAHRGGGGGGGFRRPRREAPMDDDDVPLRKEKGLLLAKVRKLEEEEISFRGESEAEKELASRILVSRNPSGASEVEARTVNDVCCEEPGTEPC
ncbi:hypothetical protein SASPL_120240 [Salvia splendens]|uniref:Uncharacterized protein n=1 Tax=Salvia splendens TaxID=180675 RepID=A0A8X8XSK8_SALSN|nr:hypothetical protein SASPL_120240 [Salvia splendens]